ncbi:hypothetical protein ANN_27091 [Periplaneta americana]|uniref:Transferrin-like domain-containing protein n=1 Tax=Periplaneta americana TaxID=6978 RepID=A0ABQ8RX79_PERAM|nr:hypothetical protein ANN_27091 [Periplaneta americana]
MWNTVREELCDEKQKKRTRELWRGSAVTTIKLRSAAGRSVSALAMSKLSLLLLLQLPAALLLAIPTPHVYKVCVPDGALNDCEQMASETALHMHCVPARDRTACLDKIQHHDADFVPVDPEDIFLASKITNQSFIVFKEIRTKEEPDEEFRYEAVAVIHKNQNITSVQGLRGLKSCHTGVGRNVGYKIPITKLRKMGVLTNLNDPDMTPRENELHALSQLFSKACLVGKWAPDPAQNQALKYKRRFSIRRRIFAECDISLKFAANTPGSATAIYNITSGCPEFPSAILLDPANPPPAYVGPSSFA